MEDWELHQYPRILERSKCTAHFCVGRMEDWELHPYPRILERSLREVNVQHTFALVLSSNASR